MSPEWIKHPNAKALVRAPDNDPYSVAPLAGRDLDALVAEKVMGWERCTSRGLAGPTFEYWVPPQGVRRMPNVEPPEFSTDVAAAWSVLLRFGDGSRIELVHARVDERYVKVQFWATLHADGARSMATEETAPLAICRAALRLATTNPPRASGSSDRE